MSVPRHLLTALRAMIVLTIALGIAYPVAVFGIGRLMPGRTDGSLIMVAGAPVGSELIGQPFTDPALLWGRPSAAGAGYDAGASGGSNLGPNDPALLTAVHQRRAAIARACGVAPAQVPADAVTASGSGLDPDISPAYAAIQVNRIARARGISPAVVRAAIAAGTHGRWLGIGGEPTVNVVEVNLRLLHRA